MELPSSDRHTHNLVHICIRQLKQNGFEVLFSNQNPRKTFSYETRSYYERFISSLRRLQKGNKWVYPKIDLECWTKYVQLCQFIHS